MEIIFYRQLKRIEWLETRWIETSLIVVFLLNLIFFPFLVKGKEEIKLHVAPEMFEWQVKREEQFSEKIKIYNKSEVAVPVEIIVTNFGAQEESGTMTFYEDIPSKEQNDDISYNPRKWVKIENPNFILDPEETEEVKFKVTIPENAEPGGHYAVILFEPKLPSFYFQEESLRAIPKIGVLLLFSVEVEGITKAKEPLTVVEFNIPEDLHLKRLESFLAKITGLFIEVKAAKESLFSIVETSHLPFTLRIKNNDIYHWKPEGKLTILRENGKVVGETEIKKTTILPGKTRKFPVEFRPELPEKIVKFLPASLSDFISKNLLIGKYRAQLFLTREGDIIEENIEFWAFPWKVWLLISLLFVLILTFVIKYRKRIKSAMLILFGARPREVK